MSSAEDLVLAARVVGSVVVVLVLLALVARTARKAGVRGPGAGLRVIDRTGLSRDASVAVVEVGGKALVLGVTAHGVNVLAELDPEEVAVPATAPVRERRVVAVQDGQALGAPGAGAAGRAVGPQRQASGSVLSPATWRQGVEALRDLTARRTP